MTPLSSAFCPTLSLFLYGYIKEIFFSQLQPYSHLRLSLSICLSFSFLSKDSQLVYNSLSIPPSPPRSSLWAVTVLMQCCMSMPIDFFLSVSLFLFAPRCTFCQHCYAWPTAYSTPPCVWLRACWLLWGWWGVRREKKAPSSHVQKPHIHKVYNSQINILFLLCSHRDAHSTTRKTPLITLSLCLILSSTTSCPTPVFPGNNLFLDESTAWREKSCLFKGGLIIQHNILSRRKKRKFADGQQEKRRGEEMMR